MLVPKTSQTTPVYSVTFAAAATTLNLHQYLMFNYQAITWTNVDQLSVRSSHGDNLKKMSKL